MRRRALAACLLLLSLGAAAARAEYGSSPFSSGGSRRSSSSSPFASGGREDREPEREVTIVIGVGAPLTLEQSAVVKTIWDDMKTSYTYSDDGELESNMNGKEMLATPEILGAFYRYVSNHPVTKTGYENEKCTVCPGSGTIIVYEDVQRLRFTRETCGACEGTGKRRVAVTYKVVCPADRLPPKARTPRQLRHDALVSSAGGGDVKSRLELAKICASGSQVAPRDEPKATEIYYGLALEGNVEGFRGYAEMLGRCAQTKSQKTYADLIARACDQVSGYKNADAAPSAASYLEQLETQLLTEVAVEQFVRHKLDAKDRTVNSLVGGLADKGQSAVRDVVVRQLKARKPRYDAEAVGKLMACAESMDPEAFAVLGAICETGADGGCKPQAGHVFYALAARLKPSLGTAEGASRLAASCDPAAAAELLESFDKVSARGKCPRTFIESVYNLKGGAR